MPLVRAPPAPAPPLAALQMVRPLGAATSSRFPGHPPTACIDRNLTSICATNREANAWASVQLPEFTVVDRVVVHNRNDNNKEYQSWLSPFEVWLGESYGDMTSPVAKRCGQPELRVPATAGPFTVSCGGVRGRFATVVHKSTVRALTIAEITVYGRPPAGYKGMEVAAPTTSAKPAPSTISKPAPKADLVEDAPKISPVAASKKVVAATRHTARCHSGTEKEQHRLGAPRVKALSCSALVLELPPLPPDHCDEDDNQRLAIEAKHGTQASEWYEIKHNVLSPTLILGGLEHTSAYEFRTVLHRPQLGDRRSESSGLKVVAAECESIDKSVEVHGGGGSSFFTFLFIVSLAFVGVMSATLIDPANREKLMDAEWFRAVCDRVRDIHWWYAQYEWWTDAEWWQGVYEKVTDAEWWKSLWKEAKDVENWQRLVQKIRDHLAEIFTEERIEAAKTTVRDGAAALVENASWLQRAWVDGLGSYERAGTSSELPTDQADEEDAEEMLPETPMRAAPDESDAQKLETDDYAPAEVVTPAEEQGGELLLLNDEPAAERAVPEEELSREDKLLVDEL